MALYDLAGKRVYVAGHKGMVGSALVRRLGAEDCEVLTTDRSVDLRVQSAVEQAVSEMQPDAVVIAAAKVGGILANDSYPGQFLYDNLMIATNLVEASRKAGVGKLLSLGSSCIYPKFAPQPIPEDALLTGALEPTNEWYAIAKIAAIKLCQAYRREYGCDFISAMPTNLYGIGDNFDLDSSHVLPALIRKAHDAKAAKAASMEVWGSGNPRREFLFADDCADALVFLLKNYSGDEHVNVGSGTDVSIRELAELVAATVGFEGQLAWDTSRPDGTPRKLMSGDKLRAMGWAPKTALPEGIAATYDWYRRSLA